MAETEVIVEPGLYMHLRFQTAAVRGNYETGNQAFSMRLRFLTIQHPDFTAVRFIRDAYAVLVRLGDPQLAPCFPCSFLIDMPPSTIPGSPSAAFAQFFADSTGLRHNISDSALPFIPSSASDGKRFRGFPDSLSATACRFARLPGGSDRAFPQPTETFTPELSAGRSPFLLSSITKVATEQASPAGLAPTGTSTSIAALCRSFQTRS
jgi:hypothetical protein